MRSAVLCLALFSTYSFAARNELDILKPCFEALADSPNSETAPTPRGNSLWLGYSTGFSVIGTPVYHTFDTLILPVRKADPNKVQNREQAVPETEMYEIHVLKTNPKGELRIRKFSITSSALLHQKGVVLPITADCTTSALTSTRLAAIPQCWELPLALELGQYKAYSTDLQTKKSIQSKIQVAKQITDLKQIEVVQKYQTEQKTLKEITNVSKQESLQLVVDDLAVHIKEIFSRPLFTESALGRKRIVNTLMICKKTYDELAKHDFVLTSNGTALSKLNEAIKAVDIVTPIANIPSPAATD